MVELLRKSHYWGWTTRSFLFLLVSSCLGQETQGMYSRPVEICTLVWWVQIWDFWFQTLSLCEMQRRWADGFCMCCSHCESWSRRCDGVGCLAGDTVGDLFRIQDTLIQHDTTAFCSAMPFHLVCAYWDHHLFFNKTMTQTHLQAM